MSFVLTTSTALLMTTVTILLLYNCSHVTLNTDTNCLLTVNTLICTDVQLLHCTIVMLAGTHTIHSLNIMCEHPCFCILLSSDLTLLCLPPQPYEYLPANVGLHFMNLMKWTALQESICFHKCVPRILVLLQKKLTWLLLDKLMQLLLKAQLQVECERHQPFIESCHCVLYVYTQRGRGGEIPMISPWFDCF